MLLKKAMANELPSKLKGNLMFLLIAPILANFYYIGGGGVGLVLVIVVVVLLVR
jgi:hypothetical protein